MSNDSKYSIGIDLGTTNSAFASYNHHDEESEQARSFMIPQLIDQSMVDALPSLSSFLYHPAEHEMEGKVFQLPWNENPSHIVGAYARDQGEKTPQRLSSSAKSWLCSQEGRHAKILPLAAPPEIEKMSAVEASSAYLKHLFDAWNHANPEDGLSTQDVTLTVPASFDVVARDLSMDAAKNAGFGEITLLEEPIAAFYAWIAENQDDWRTIINVGDVVLVCDIGGGTTDFSLISVSEEEGNLTLSRIAVGEHILLGGDNMDLALARTVQVKMEQDGKKLEQWQFFGLAHSCRKAKESLLSDPSLGEVSVVIPGRGSKLIGGTLSSNLTRNEIEGTLLEGFFGECGVNDHPQVARRTGLRTIGLNYAADSAILKHLARFLSESKKYVDSDSPLAEKIGASAFVHPTAILFNGGVTKAGIFQERIMAVINQWLQDDNGSPVSTLQAENPDLAVSLGAAYYGSVRRGKGVRVKSASAFSYYIGVESAMPAIPGMPALLNGLCVVPVGTEEGSSFDIPGLEFGLVVGEPVDFRFFIGRDRPEDQLGETVENAEESLEELTTLEVHFSVEEGESADQTVIPVRLRVILSEIGSLELWCDAIEGDQSWKLEFNLREEQS
ncbi:MAG: Hsp70 family protein [SAR324 cluster bacterium]|nr:Hsp70 family protein [SAR324 cluster bacterium]